ncbi:MAG: 50S ribosome-binding GTPase, partial [Ilumatobacter sp.]|nr:50S ribosome-binding GTPase [Ilumatobacter sp.]
MNDPTSTAPDTGNSSLPTVVIVGRPNVGKSTLFNRVVGHQVAIVEDRPGVTRDRKEVEAEWLGNHFLLVDTGGWLPGGTELDEKVSRQVEAAVKAADVVLFVVDASVGLTDDDESIANWLRRIHAPVLVVANKADNDRRENEMWEFLGLGMGEPVPVSALHGRRAGDLLDVVVAQFPEGAGRLPDPAAGGIPLDDDGEMLWRPDDVPPPRVAIVGRPNVG